MTPVSFELWQLFLAAVAYLLLLFYIAYATERGWLPAGIARHPLTYTLSLGVYATSWSYYGSVGFAQAQGYNFLTIYLGVTLVFLLTPVLLQPILRLTREYQLASLADLFAFRYQSQLAGVLVTLFMLAGILPYLALQVRAVTESIRVLTHDSTPQPFLALAFCLTLILFAVLFGARHSSAREKHEGLVVAIAFESLVKLAALLAVGLFVLLGVFDGIGGLDRWLATHPEAIQALYQPVREGSWPVLLLLAFSAAFLLPRQFHMTFTENIEPRTLATASWAFPLFLLLLNLAIPPILWAGQYMGLRVSPDYYVLGVTLHGGSSVLPVLTFLGGVSAASAMMIVETLALASMCMNHLVLPASFPRLASETNIYRWLIWGRRLLIAIIILAGYGFYLLLEHNQGLVQLGLISFVAVAQFLPGIAGLLFWPRSTRNGFIAGLLGGGTVWAILLVVPLLERSGMLPAALEGLSILAQGEGDPWSRATFLTLTANGLLFAVVSLLTRPSEAERESARACCRNALALPTGIPLATSPAQFKEQLTHVIGPEMAEREVGQALTDLGLNDHEQRLGELSQLRERIERNLSGLVGPLLARMIVNERLLMDSSTRSAVAASLRYVEQRLEESRSQLRGQAAELDNLRRYHRQVLLDLPLGVCAVGPDMEVISWNQAMTALSGLEDFETFGRRLKELPEPWSGLLRGFLRTKDRHMHKVKVNSEGRTRMFNLHKAAIESVAGFPWDEADPAAANDTVILIEDLTDLYLLESELAHSERLASVGRLAAGVAHEIGNPITGIACLAQNVLSEGDDTAFVRESAEQILEQTRRVSNIVQSLVSFSHGGTVEDRPPAAFNLHICVENAIRLMRLSHAGKQIEFINHCAEGLTLHGNSQRMEQVFVNLLSNACDASEPGRRIEIEGRREGDVIEAVVTDQGKGIPDELQERVFEPFFTTKQPGEGTGLGLPMVYNIVGEHGGTVTLRSRLGLGTSIVLRLPAPPAEGKRNRKRRIG